MIPQRLSASSPGVVAPLGIIARSLALGLFLAAVSPGPATSSIWTVTSIVETEATDFPDDICIWVHPIDRGKSIVLGTSKDSPIGGLHAWGLDAGASIWNNAGSENSITNNVDLRYGFPAQAEIWDIVCTSNRNSRTIDVYRVEADENDDFLGLVKEGSIPIGTGWASGSDAPYGCSMFQVENRYYCFISDKTGNVGQFHLAFDSNAPAGLRIVGTREVFWDITVDASEVEGIVADDLNKVIYIAAENEAIYRFETESDLVVPASTTTVAVPDFGNGPFVPDVEGLTLWYSSSDGEGYLIASSQGRGSESSDFYSTYAVFDRRFAPGQPNTHLFNYEINAGAGPLDRVTETDGIDVLNLNLSSTFDAGLMVAHDDVDEGGENYKFISWRDIATSPSEVSDHLRFIGDGLESGWNPRTRSADDPVSSIPSDDGSHEAESETSIHPRLSLSPQPFSESTTIHFWVGEITGVEHLSNGANASDPGSAAVVTSPMNSTATHVRVSVFSIDGREVALLAHRIFSPGPHTLIWNGADNANRKLPAAPYWIRVQTDQSTQIIQSTLLPR